SWAAARSTSYRHPFLAAGEPTARTTSTSSRVPATPSYRPRLNSPLPAVRANSLACSIPGISTVRSIASSSRRGPSPHFPTSPTGQQLRDKLTGGMTNYPAPNAEGYPPNVDVSRRLAFVFGAFPDYCDLGRPYLDGENVPTQRGPNQDFVANERYCNVPGAAR